MFLANGEAGLERQRVKFAARLDRLTRTIHALAYAASAMLVFMAAAGAWRVLSGPVGQ